MCVWAGMFRKSEKNIGVGPYQISIEIHNLFEDTKTWIKYKSYSEKEILARFHHRLVFIHAYSNGNGRHSRIFTDLLAKELLGCDLDWNFKVSPKDRRDEYIAVLREADMKNYGPLIDYFYNMGLVI